jgi:hypothetical protein
VVASVLLSLCVDCCGCVKCICRAGLIFESDDHLIDASNVSVVSEVANVEYPVGDECAGCEGTLIHPLDKSQGLSEPILVTSPIDSIQERGKCNLILLPDRGERPLA